MAIALEIIVFPVPYSILALLLSILFSYVWHIFPLTVMVQGQPWTWTFVKSAVWNSILPAASIVVVVFGWWVISGDLPTDYISSADVKPPQHPRNAMRSFAKNWLEVVKAWKNGREIENTRIGDQSSHEELGPLLESRAELLMEWAAHLRMLDALDPSYRT